MGAGPRDKKGGGAYSSREKKNNGKKREVPSCLAHVSGPKHPPKERKGGGENQNLLQNKSHWLEKAPGVQGAYLGANKEKTTPLG